MTTRIVSQGPMSRVDLEPTANRTTSTPSRPFGEVLRASANAVVGSAESAVQKLPGGPILAAAFRPGTANTLATNAPVGSGVATSSNGSSPGSGSASGASGLTPTGLATSNLSPTGQSSTGDVGIEATLAQNGDKTLYYLDLQERISAENRSYTTLSNVLKARHETIKNAIGNIR